MVLLAAMAACADEQVSTDAAPPATSGEQLHEGDLTVLESPEHGPHLCYLVQTSLPPQCEGLPVEGWEWDAVEGAESRNGTTWGRYHVVGTFDGTTFTLSEASASHGGGDDDDGDPDFSPACEDPEVLDGSHGVFEWEAMSQDYGPFEIPDLVATWVSHAGDGVTDFVGNVVVRPGTSDAAHAVIREHYLGPLCLTERDGATERELGAIHDEVADESERLRVVASWTETIAGVVEVEVWVADQETVAYVRDRWGDLVRLHGILQPVT